MSPRYVAFATLTILSVIFLVPTGNSDMAVSAALSATGVLSDASAPVVESADSLLAQSDKSQRQATPVKRDVVASPASAPIRTSVSSSEISDARRTLWPANVRPKVAAESAGDVSPNVGLTSGVDSSRGNAPPRNDNCLNADSIIVNVNSAIGTTVDATPDAAPICDLNGNSTPGVWYSAIGTGNTMVAKTCSEFTTHPDTVVLVYCAGCDTLNCVASNDNNCPGIGTELSSTVFWCSEVGVEYLILVQDFGTGSGAFTLTVSDNGVTCDSPPNCADVVACGLSSPTCDGECPLGEICRASIVAGDLCVCVPNDVDCGQSQAPACNGVCPNPEDICTGNVQAGACICQPPPPVLCEQSEFGICDGECPPDSVCVSDEATDLCRCRAMFPPAGTDLSPTVGILRIDVIGVGIVDAKVSGETLLQWKDPQTDPVTGQRTVQTEILSMDLSGFHPSIGNMKVRAGGLRGLPATLGSVKSLGPDGDFPALASFDVFFEVEVVGVATLRNAEPFVMQAVINSIPPRNLGLRNVAPVILTDIADPKHVDTLQIGFHWMCPPPFPPPGVECPVPCNANPFPVCGFGDCPANTECVPDDAIGRCTCQPIVIRCEDSDPATCGGVCPNPEDICTGNVRGGACICQPPIEENEACCLDNGSCLDLPPSECRGADGAPRGPGTVCRGDHDPANEIDDACEFDTKCQHCGPGPHWIDTCPAGHDRLPSGVVIGLDTNGDCLVDQNLVMFGPAEVSRAAGVPHQIVPTEMVAMRLAGGGAVLRAGAGGGIGPGSPLGASFGKIIENGGDPSLGDSSFDIFFELDLGAGLFAYNQTPLSLTAGILCVSPNRIYAHPRGCLPLFDSPTPGLGNFVANLVTANHDPFGDPLCPLPDDFLFPCIERQIFDCVGSDLELCLPRIFTNTDGKAEALRCDCFDDNDACGPVFIRPDGDFFGCDGSCPGAKQLCEIYIDGSSTGAGRIPIADVADGAAVTCECPCTKSAPPGTDGWATACDGSTSYDFALTPIPADFFGLGSAPFVDVVALGGVTGGLDTQIQRLDSMCFDGPLPVTQASAIEIVQLDLVSCEKIIVDFGDRTEDWTVFVRLIGTQPQGTLTAIKAHDAGGTYTADIPINAEFLFVRNIDGEPAGPLPAGITTLSTTVPAPWDQTNCATGFCPGFAPDPDGGTCCKPTCHGGPSPGHKHCTQPPDCPACTECTWNNGPPLDDLTAPASQYDGFAPDVFSAEAADDFFFTGKGTNPCDILRARFWVSYFNMPPDVVQDPVAQWTGVTVSIYDDADPKGPAGNRNEDGSFTTGLVATRTVPMPDVVVTPSSLPCLGPIFQIDVNFANPISLEKNHKYWIVFQPHMDFSDDPAGGPGYGQVAPLLSRETHGHPAQQIFASSGLPNWTEFSGNIGSTNPLCDDFPPGSRKDIAFELFAFKPVPCDQTFPACGGDCPAGSICESVPGANVCRCRSVECAPNAEGTACNGGSCSLKSECNARCVNFDPTTGARRIVDCVCRNSVECHVAPLGPNRGTNSCSVVDNGSGTVTLPPQGCEYLSPDDVHMIIDGLPPGTTIELGAIHKDFICGDRPVDLCSLPLPPGVCEGVGGTLGGSADCFDSVLELNITGTGALSGFVRSLSIPIGCEVHTGPRNPGDAVQTFPTEMFRLQGELFGDPDFCTLKVTGGRDFGLPSPGQTTLTQLPSGDFIVDSFFDVTYQIDFVGCTNSVLQGVSGTTQATIRMQTGTGIDPPTCIGACRPGTECRRSSTANADGTITVCCDCVTPEPVSTFPPHCAIDAGQPHGIGPDENQECVLLQVFGWDSLTLQFNVDPTLLNLQPGDFSLQMFPPGVAPVITNVVADAASQTVLVRFNGPIEPRHWTCVVFTATGRRWCLGYLPADASQDGLSAASDIEALINSINLVPGQVLPPYATDINRSGVTTGSDILREIDLLNGAGCFDVWIRRSLPDCPASHPGPPG